MRPSLGDDVIGHPLLTLPGQSHPTRDLGNRQRFLQDGAQYLPPGRGPLMWGRDHRSRLQELPVEGEDGKDQGGEGVPLRRSARRRSPP